MSGYVYFIQCGRTGPIKIGYATNVVNRMVELQVGNPFPLRLIAAIEGTRETEVALHAQFKPLHIRGEWFAAAVALLEYIENIPDCRVSFSIAEINDNPMHNEESEETWFDKSIATDKEAAEIIGINPQRAREYFGPSGRKFQQWRGKRPPMEIGKIGGAKKGINAQIKREAAVSTAEVLHILRTSASIKVAVAKLGPLFSESTVRRIYLPLLGKS